MSMKREELGIVDEFTWVKRTWGCEAEEKKGMRAGWSG